MTGAGNHTYLMVSAGEALLIDAGVGEDRHLAALAQHLETNRAHLRDVLVTHAHADHASGATALARAHPAARFHKWPWPQQHERYQVAWHDVKDGDRLSLGDESFVALHTPGHSPDHVACWHEASGTVFSGDLVIAGSSVMIAASSGGDLGEYLASLERIRGLQPRRLLPAHGQEITNPDELLGQYIAHRMTREEQVLAALRRGERTIEAIADSIYHGLDPRLVPAAQENVRAHLAKLKREGKID